MAPVQRPPKDPEAGFHPYINGGFSIVIVPPFMDGFCYGKSETKMDDDGGTIYGNHHLEISLGWNGVRLEHPKTNG